MMGTCNWLRGMAVEAFWLGLVNLLFLAIVRAQWRYFLVFSRAFLVGRGVFTGTNAFSNSRYFVDYNEFPIT